MHLVEIFKKEYSIVEEYYKTNLSFAKIRNCVKTIKMNEIFKLIKKMAGK